MQILDNYLATGEEEYKEASKTKRLLNFAIDTSIWIMLLWGISFMSQEWQIFHYFFMVIFWFVLFGGYWILGEYFFGKTVGKIVTNTKVVFKKNVHPEFRLIVIRTWSRAIPFEFLSPVLGHDAKAWHDILSKTIVVDDKD